MRTTVLKLLGGLTTKLVFPEPIYEFGAYRVPGQEHLPQVRDFFPNRAFVGCDLQSGPGVDRIEDLHAIGLPDASIGTVLLFDTIEHVREPWRALAELHRCLAPGGILIMTSHMYFPIHAYPDDYFRFTGSGFRSLLQPYDSVIVAACGLARLPHTVVGVAAKSPFPSGQETVICRELEEWKRRGSRTWKETVLDVCPPFLLIPAYAAFLKTMRFVNHVLLRRPRTASQESELLTGSPEGPITANRR